MTTERERLLNRLELANLKCARMAKALMLIEGIIDDFDTYAFDKREEQALRKQVNMGLGQTEV